MYVMLYLVNILYLIAIKFNNFNKIPLDIKFNWYNILKIFIQYNNIRKKSLFLL